MRPVSRFNYFSRIILYRLNPLPFITVRLGFQIGVAVVKQSELDAFRNVIDSIDNIRFITCQSDHFIGKLQLRDVAHQELLLRFLTQIIDHLIIRTHI